MSLVFYAAPRGGVKHGSPPGLRGFPPTGRSPTFRKLQAHVPSSDHIAPIGLMASMLADCGTWDHFVVVAPMPVPRLESTCDYSTHPPSAFDSGGGLRSLKILCGKDGLCSTRKLATRAQTKPVERRGLSGIVRCSSRVGLADR